MIAKFYIMVAATCLLTVGQTSGAVVLEENFGALSPGGLNGQNSWTAVSGVNVVAGGLNYSSGNITINGGNRHASHTLLSVGVAPIAYNQFAAQSGDVWFRLTFRVSASVNNSRYWFWVSDTTSINSGVTGTAADSNTGNKNLFAEIRNNTSPVSTLAAGINDSTINLVVARLSKDGTATNTDAYDRMEVWLNPDDAALGAPTATANGPINSSFTGGIAYFGLTTLNTAAKIEWDNLLVGTSQGDVIWATVPEPGSMALLVLGCVASWAFRRRTRYGGAT